VIIPIAVKTINGMTPAIISMLYLTMVFSYLISPMHLCLVLTVEYHKSRLHTVYRKLIPASVVTYLATMVVAAILIWKTAT